MCAGVARTDRTCRCPQCDRIRCAHLSPAWPGPSGRPLSSGTVQASTAATPNPWHPALSPQPLRLPTPHAHLLLLPPTLLLLLCATGRRPAVHAWAVHPQLHRPDRTAALLRPATQQERHPCPAGCYSRGALGAGHGRRLPAWHLAACRGGCGHGGKMEGAWTHKQQRAAAWGGGERWCATQTSWDQILGSGGGGTACMRLHGMAVALPQATHTLGDTLSPPSPTPNTPRHCCVPSPPSPPSPLAGRCTVGAVPAAAGALHAAPGVQPAGLQRTQRGAGGGAAQ